MPSFKLLAAMSSSLCNAGEPDLEGSSSESRTEDVVFGSLVDAGVAVLALLRSCIHPSKQQDARQSACYGEAAHGGHAQGRVGATTWLSMLCVHAWVWCNECGVSLSPSVDG